MTGTPTPPAPGAVVRFIHREPGRRNIRAGYFLETMARAGDWLLRVPELERARLRVSPADVLAIAPSTIVHRSRGEIRTTRVGGWEAPRDEDQPETFAPTLF